jgi:hypothetical protein
MNSPEPPVLIVERGLRESSLGRVLQLKVCTEPPRPLTWDEVYDAFTAKYPGRWAVEVFPPLERLVNGKAVRHLWVLEGAPSGLDLMAGGVPEPSSRLCAVPAFQAPDREPAPPCR